MKISVTGLSSLLRLLYQAPGNPASFVGFLDSLGAELRADKAYFILFDSAHRCDFSLQYGFDERAASDYAQYFSGRDLLAFSFFEKLKAHGEWFGTSQSVISDSEYFSSEIFNDFAKPNGQRYFCAAGLDLREVGLQGGLGLSRPPGSREFDKDEVELLAVLGPHLRQAVKLHQAFTRLKISDTILKDCFQRIEDAFIYVDAQGKIVRLTDAARKMLEVKDGLTEDHGFVRASTAEEQGRLGALILHAAAGNGPAAECPVRIDSRRAPEVGKALTWTPSFGGRMQLSRKPPRRPLKVVVVPFLAMDEFSTSGPCAILIVSDPEFKPLPRSSLLRSMYGLSPSECRVIELLAEGQTVTQIAQRLGRTEEGTRFQLKSIFRKTGTRRQTDLLRLVLSLPSFGNRALASGPSSFSRP